MAYFPDSSIIYIMPHIAATAIIHPSARIHESVIIGDFCVIEANVRIGEGCVIGHHAVIRRGTVVGNDVRIDDHAVIGKQPMRAARSATTDQRTQPGAILGHKVIVGTGAVLYAGCKIGNKVLVADLATIREDVEVDEGTIVGRGVAIENKCRVGARCKLETNAYLAAYTTVEDDVFIAPGVLTSNDRFIGRTEERFAHFGGPIVRRAARLAVGAVLLPGVDVPEEAVIGAGAVLTKDGEAAQIHLGIPARSTKSVPKEQLIIEKSEVRSQKSE